MDVEPDVEHDDLRKSDHSLRVADAFQFGHHAPRQAVGPDGHQVLDPQEDSRAAVDPPGLVCVLAIRRHRDILSFVPPLVEHSQLGRCCELH